MPARVGAELPLDGNLGTEEAAGAGDVVEADSLGFGRSMPDIWVQNQLLCCLQALSLSPVSLITPGRR